MADESIPREPSEPSQPSEPSEAPLADEPLDLMPPRRSIWPRIGLCVAMGIFGWAVASYLLVPELWKEYGRKHPSLEDIPGITYTASGIPGDPINVSLIGTQAELIKAMLAAQWYPADPLSLKSCLEIAEATVFKRPYDAAPVSSLYLLGRKEDLAFEQPVGNDPRRRHHVRFWKTEKVDDDGRPIWVGSAVFDEHVGLSKTTGQITHVTAADVDAERDYLFQCLEKAGALTDRYVEEGFHKVREGKNGGGDPWRTDGNLWVGVLAAKPH